VGEVFLGGFSGQEEHHHVEGAEVAMELASGLHQRLPVLHVFVQRILRQLLVDILQLVVQAQHDLLELGVVGDFVPNGGETLLGSPQN
jgi:hypothetical protein